MSTYDPDSDRAEQRERRAQRRADRARYFPSCEDPDPAKAVQARRRADQEWAVRECARLGHQAVCPAPGQWVCKRCGYLLDEHMKPLGEEMP